ncbi:hypothetical protein PFISCL1PPCAC_5034 [Pristionchus fissidentatus]|uniref:Carboxypeptidase n=1 Tax=Pristionchus fissidentatus TaxID=1538716 RepID=A0AAV5V628_9BILA|nr:hypothetical protein PFISCL1PPCAC_5034 [Pristionchus fissidentatus]
MKFLISLALLLPAVLAIGQDDIVKDLPGLLFKPNFQTYSGYLDAGQNGDWQMHYWLFESRNDKNKDPILVWLNGGPGCSSVAGMFEELGPFYVTFDGQNLFENVHSWNARANVLAIESPIGVGFSYNRAEANYSVANDDQTADQNYNALKDFFGRVQKTYGDREFYLAGESYAGIYIPTLSKKIVDGIASKDFPNVNFRGAAIGNGFMDVPKLMNSLVLWGNYHGRMSVEDWDTVKSLCGTGGQDVEKYDFTKYFVSENGMDYVSDGSLCGNLTAPMLVLDDNMDQYNFYQDCYAGTSIVLPNVGRGASGIKRRRVKRGATAWKIVNSENPANDLWQDSTDTQLGYPCWNEDAVTFYLNREDVQKALNIPQEWRDTEQKTWVDCNDPIYNDYHLTYTTTYEFFNYVLRNYDQQFRFLIFNGDVDTVCNFLGDAWLMNDVANYNNMVHNARQQWYFRNQSAGYSQNYMSKDGSKTIDVVTVKGAGHFVPNDRPGPSAQMITNFMFTPKSANGQINYSDASFVDPTPVPLPLVNEVPPTVPTIDTTTTSATTVSLFSALLIVAGAL